MLKINNKNLDRFRDFLSKIIIRSYKICVFGLIGIQKFRKTQACNVLDKLQKMAENLNKYCLIISINLSLCQMLTHEMFTEQFSLII